MAAGTGYRASIKQRELDLKEVQCALRDLDVDQPDEVSRALARYLTVRSAGYLEAVRDDLAGFYASVTGHPRLHKRIVQNLRSGLGVTPDQLLTFVGTFDTDWRTSLEEFLDANDRALRSQLGAMVAARKKVAHGDGENVTTSRALAWADAALAIGKHLGTIFEP